MRINIDRININQNSTHKFCVITDIHHIKSMKDKFYDAILKRVKNEHPSYILIPGDIIDNPKIINTLEINYLINFFKKLALIAPVLISKGNHELKNEKISINNLYQKIVKIENLYVLDNKSVILGDYQFIGFCPSNKSYLNKYKKIWFRNFINEFKECRFKINAHKKVVLLCHSPLCVVSEEVKNSHILDKIDYVICGHMHNGLCPKVLDKAFHYRGIFGPEKTIFPQFCRGTHEMFIKTKLIVCKSLRVLTPDNPLFKMLDCLYAYNITIIKL